MIDGKFEEVTRALVSYVMEDAKCPDCDRVDECAPWCGFVDRLASANADRMARARVAVHCYRTVTGTLAL